MRLPLEDPAVDGVTAAIHDVPRSRAMPVLLAPGAGGDLDGEGLTALAETLAGLGHPVVRVNLPHHELGRRSAPRAERSVAPLQQLLRAAREELGRTGRWILGGKSYGGRVASLAVAGGTDAAGLLFYGYPLHPPGRPEKLRVDHWPDVGVPCLFLHGTRDPFGDVELLETQVRKLPRRVTLQVVEGGDHSLRVTGRASPDGTPRSEAASIAALAQPLREWIGTLEP